MLRRNRCGEHVHMSSVSHSDRKKYWATEAKKVLSLIGKYRENQVIVSYGVDKHSKGAHNNDN